MIDFAVTVLTSKNLVLFCLVSTLGGLLGASVCAAADRAHALELYESGRFEEALPLYRELSQATPDDGVLRHRLGVCLEMTGETAEGRRVRGEAVEALERAVASSSPPVSALYYLVGDYQLTGDSEKAAGLLERVVALFSEGGLTPGSTSEKYQLAALLEQAGRPVQSSKLLGEVVEAFRSGDGNNQRYFSDALVRLGNLEFEKKNREEAVALFREAQEADPANPGAYYVEGVVQDSVGELDAAAELYGKALQLDSGHFYARYNLANLKARQGDLRGALKEFEQALAAEPRGDDLVRLYLALAKLSEAAGEFRKAAEYYERLGQIRPGPEVELSARYALAHAHWKEGARDEALDLLRDVAGHAPDVAALRAEIASLLSEMGNHEDAVTELMSALALAPQEGRLYLALGRAYLAQDRVEDARSAFEKARELEGTKEAAEKELAALTSEGGEGP